MYIPNRNTRRRPRTRNLRSMSIKHAHGKTGGEYEFLYRGKIVSLAGHYKIDPMSPDGRRWIASREAAKIIRRIVCELADATCELHLDPSCWRWLPLGSGHPHHLRLKKMGGAFTEDRIWVAGQRVRFWTCPTCHRCEHPGPQWTPKASAA